MKYLGALGTVIHEKNLKSKISCQTPFKRADEQYKGVDFKLVVPLVSVKMAQD
jgi:hypothetical protein